MGQQPGPAHPESVRRTSQSEKRNCRQPNLGEGAHGGSAVVDRRAVSKEIARQSNIREHSSGNRMGPGRWQGNRVKRSPYTPAQGDVVWLDFNPQAGHEQSGRRPAVILSPTAYNKRIGLALVCPLTKQAKGYPFEVELPAGLPVTGVV